MVWSLLGKKLEMTQIFNEKQECIPVTVIEAGPCCVLQVKTQKKEGYSALQLGFEDRREKNVNKPEMGKFKKAKVKPKYFVREVPIDPSEEGSFQPGDVVGVSILENFSSVDVIGMTKGRGFTGVVKRWSFKGYPATHGAKTYHRHPGSIGSSAWPSRVIKGRKMCGHYGNEQVTMKNLKVVRIDKERNLILVKGAIPGPTGGYLLIRKSIKMKAPAVKLENKKS